MTPPTTPTTTWRPRLRYGAALALALAILSGCASNDADSTACRDDDHQTRTDDSHCQDNQPHFDWVSYPHGTRVPAIGEPIGSVTPLSPGQSAPSARRGGVAPSGGTAGDEQDDPGSSSGRSGARSGYIPPMEEPGDEPGEDDDE